VESRAALKQARSEAQHDSKMESNVEEKKKSNARQKRIKARLIPIWLRLVILVCLIIICVTAGAMVGYGALGGGKATDILKESTWTHIQDLVDKK
jgi:hypothetical protein